MNRRLKMAFALGISCSLSLCALTVNAALLTKHSAAQNGAKVFREYKGVKLGLKREQVQAALGKPENSNANSEDYNLPSGDAMTVHYDNDEVRAIQLMFLDPKNAPEWKEVVGNAEITELANGAKTARKVYNEEKFWVSIYTNKEGSMIRITISR